MGEIIPTTIPTRAVKLIHVMLLLPLPVRRQECSQDMGQGFKGAGGVLRPSEDLDRLGNEG